uniref:Uncharacterized protein n=1 Tax=Oryza sativa subsp. japonica TaxID=39947 RepID=Q6YYU2_ORYSJ|nr:hypothetical protein [Oryza sativa Japonica Group]BAD34055.1 hypothetical protein [Oryza sativa Japonica Group]
MQRRHRDMWGWRRGLRGRQVAGRTAGRPAERCAAASEEKGLRAAGCREKGSERWPTGRRGSGRRRKQEGRRPFSPAAGRCPSRRLLAW